MKKIYILHILTALILVTSSCKNILDLSPAQSLDNDAALSTDESVKQVLLGAYTRFGADGLYGGDVLRNAELYAGFGEILWVGTFIEPAEIFNRNILTANFDVLNLWSDAYECINSCNNVLSALDVVEAADRNKVEGEARCLRAWCYFMLIQNFGQQYETGIINIQPGVPLVLTPTTNFDESDFVTRNSVEEVYAQIILDLTTAESFLPLTNGVYANKNVADAILSRVYLQQGDFANARDAADKVISTNKFDLLENYADCFNQDAATDEDIFSIQISDQEGINNMNTYFAITTNGGRGDIEIETAHLDLYNDLDTRKALFTLSSSAWRSGKWNNRFGNIGAIRLAEMFLIRAECNHRLSTEIGDTPLNDYNTIHTRAGLDTALVVTLDDILLERRLELAHEGFKVFDNKRLHIDIGTTPWNSDKMIYPIPQSEMDVNSNLTQNPGY
ncbi:MAG: RagB/SusD family nutrient uptake outer membrane protein [Chitinophagales bacterium]|nr:RagB/SusD family nutrient uptake outer membrane protein [Bacteroidota bacterium]MBK8487765.1 RagB/SusD family nutrient uptake outer membrane protein [Bacteroidota bacterium]MBK8682480.1 RagB/SusD family nutrient uptake outer membrane protein [Bacteroidota bacterium]MBP7398933.1 RagB/SusD family nutrient uptake outer membrane protein [Chitinophagales bacterium]MBP9548219.1 RagB/SusD family nutrient uptake outer membrane protein [Chitinophagales bacterium]